MEFRDMTTVSRTTTFELAVSIDKLFPLLSPEGEKLWVPGWDYKNVRPQAVSLASSRQVC